MKQRHKKLFHLVQNRRMTVGRPNSSVMPNDTTATTTIIRPTEAQLRYAQFHHKRRAQAVKNRIKRLHQTPLEEVVTVNSKNYNDDDSKNDGNFSNCDESEDNSRSSNNIVSSSDTDTSDAELRAIRMRRRPSISIGRRGLLKKSKRYYRRRKKEILASGYRGYFLTEDEGTNGRSDAKNRDKHGANDSDNNDDNIALDEIFMTRPNQHKRRLGRKGGAQFQAACHAMIKNIQNSQSKASGPSIAVSSKRWKRSEEHVAAAATQQDFYRYKTTGTTTINNNERKSARSASLLLSYAYYQQNQKHHTMDRGASWLTHLPGKQSKGRNNPSNFYYFHDLAGLPPLSSNNDDPNDNQNESHDSEDGNESSITLSMRKPGPQKFHKLMAFVQQRLIDKERQHVTDCGTKNNVERRKKREISKSIESKHQQIMNSSLNNNSENYDAHGTPTMTLHNNTPFPGSVPSGSQKQQQFRRRGKSRYVPRMRLREFDVGDNSSKVTPTSNTTPLPRKRLVERFQLDTGENDSNNDDDAEYQVELPSSLSPQQRHQLPKMRLRRGFSLEHIETTGKSVHNNFNYGGDSRTKEMARSIESARNESAVNASQSQQGCIPKIKFQNGFYDDGKTSEDRIFPSTMPQTDVDRLSKQFEGKCDLVDNNENTSSDDEVKQIKIIADTKFSSETNTSDFFGQIRSDTTYDPRKQQEQNTSNTTNLSRLTISATDSHHPRRISSDKLSDISVESNTSGLWNRGRNSLSTLTTNLNTIAEIQTNKGIALLPPQVIGRASDVSGRVSGFFSKFRGVQQDDSMDKNNEDERCNQLLSQEMIYSKEYDQHPDISSRKLMPSQSGDSREALRAYRKNRESLSSADIDNEQMSLASSFHDLPIQIREIVQNSSSRFSPTESNSNLNDEKCHVSPSGVTTVTQSTTSDLSEEQYRKAHDRFLQNSTLLGSEFKHESVIDTDHDTHIDFSGDAAALDPQILANLMMSPDILQKRLKQAIHAVEQRRWEQVLFLINANPWLAEMKELTTNQYLLHKLAFFGKGIPPSPISLGERLIEKFPNAVYKFDQDGNVPLHLAAAARYLAMIKLLGDKFESGASVRNEDGMLPLHFTIASFADFIDDEVNDQERIEITADDNSKPLDIIKTVLELFPSAVAIADNDGNLPLHVAAECLHGGIGVDVVYLLMDEADRQLRDPFGARFRSKINLEKVVDEDIPTITMSTENDDTDSSLLDTEIHCSMVLNNFNETPLLSAIRSQNGWEIIEAILTGPGGRTAALNQDADNNNALHLLVGEFQDATAALVSMNVENLRCIM